MKKLACPVDHPELTAGVQNLPGRQVKHSTRMSINAKPLQGEPAKTRHAGLSSKKRDRSATVKHTRGILGRTQVELSAALGVSVKTVQSYEQGWRAVPVRVMIQLLVLLALYRKRTMDDVPCWEMRKCTMAQRERCPSFTMGRGQFCWFIGSKNCHPVAPGKAEPFLHCMNCPVVQRLLKGKGSAGL